MKVALVAKPGHEHTGIGRYNSMLLQGLAGPDLDVEHVAPVLPPLPDVAYSGMRRAGMDLSAFFNHYPVWIRYPDVDMVHFTGQNLASILHLRRPSKPAVVTVHDIIPYMLADQPKLSVYRTSADRHFDGLAMRGLRRADRLIVDSCYTRQCLSDVLDISGDHVTVVYPGIDHSRFKPVPVPADVITAYGLRQDTPYLIYVGSEDPRKNLLALVEALAIIRAGHPDVELIKVGKAQYEPERERLLQRADELGVRHAIHFLEDVADAHLPMLYSLARACVFPSLYEGFGFPVLEAMACGTPVVSSNATSLAEIIGDAALSFEPDAGAPDAIARHVASILDDSGLASWHSCRGRDHAAMFQWPEHIRQVLDVYGSLIPVASLQRLSLGAD